MTAQMPEPPRCADHGGVSLYLEVSGARGRIPLGCLTCLLNELDAALEMVLEDPRVSIVGEYAFAGKALGLVVEWVPPPAESGIPPAPGVVSVPPAGRDTTGPSAN